MHLLIATFIFILSPLCFSSERPVWVNHHPSENAEFRYYIGRSMEAISEDMAFTLATINAREQAIAQNFGIFTQIQTETYQNLEQSLSSQNFQSISQQVQLIDFEQVDFYKETSGKNNTLINVWILFKYKKLAISKEKERINQLNETLSEKFSVLKSGNEENAKISGTLEISSDPLGAPVRIDSHNKIGDLELRTPLKLMGLFSSGKHTIEIDHPNYEPIQQELILYPGLTTKVNPKLKRAYGKLQIESNIDGATVFIGTKIVGTTPLNKEINVLAGTIANIEIRHPEMFPFSTQVLVKRNEVMDIYAPLKPLESYFSVSSDPTGASIEVNDISINNVTPSGQINVLKGNHTLKIYKKGYRPFITDFEIRGGEKKVLPHVVLQKQKQANLIGLSSFSNSEIFIDSRKLDSQKNSIEVEPKNYLLTILRSGFHRFEKEITLEEGQTLDISSFELEKIPEAYERLINPTYSIGLALITIQDTNNKSDNSILALGGAFRLQPMNRIGLDIAYFLSEETLDENITSSDVPNTKSTEVVRLGLPITIYKPKANKNDSLNIIPELIQTKTEFVRKTGTNTSSANEKKFPNLTEKQNGKGLSLEYRIFTEPDVDSKAVYGFSMRAGAHKYINQDHIQSEAVLSTSFEFIVGF